MKIKNRYISAVIVCWCMWGVMLGVAMQPSVLTDRQSYSIIVDEDGVMRRSDSGEEVSYYGTNYTVPFAHAYRALNILGEDHKEIIRNDVAAMARLGFNGFRIHLWDSELADSAGNVLNNQHLDLLDYLISELQKRNIDIILTAQTNFGNGYPEKDTDTGAFTYDFPKCGIHEDMEAQKIQQNYLQQLMQHVNPYTGLCYGEDKGIIAVEINNEPCHTGSPEETTAYINRMKDALRSTGFDRIVLYNVSHNDQVRSAFYDADIQGTTYQWYPSGLVAGHERKGNFLPAVSEYNIPWKDSMRNYNRLAKVVYEFDPGDILGSYLYPAIARSFRKEGFQWITQFTYDPTPIAAYNTEYQTHYLNLAYTPAKAISMLIAGEVARNIPRYADYGPYPRNNRFDNFHVDYNNDLSILNSDNKYYYSNSTVITPVRIDSLKHIAGHGSSSIVDYKGTGAYFLDRINESGVWRLEVMPDIALVEDPFRKHDLSKKIAEIAHNKNDISLKLPQLGNEFVFQAIDSGNHYFGKAIGGKFNVTPGVYLLAGDRHLIEEIDLNSKVGNIGICEFHAPLSTGHKVVPKFILPKFVYTRNDVPVSVEILSEEKPDSIVIYPSDISFWRKDNTLIKMNRGERDNYSAMLSANDSEDVKYRVVVFKEGVVTTYPGEINKTPLDWDFPDSDYFITKIINKDDPVYLYNLPDKTRYYDLSTIPAAESAAIAKSVESSPTNPAHMKIISMGGEGSTTVWRTYVGDIIQDLPSVHEMNTIVYEVKDNDIDVGSLKFSVLNKDGATFGISYKDAEKRGYVRSLENGINRITIPISALSRDITYLVPEPFPSFMHRSIEIKDELSLCPEEIEFVELQIENSDNMESLSLYSVWLTPNP